MKEIDGRRVATWVVLRPRGTARGSASLAWRDRDRRLRERFVAKLDYAQPLDVALRAAWTQVHAHQWP